MKFPCNPCKHPKSGSVIVTVNSLHDPKNMDKVPNTRAPHPSSQNWHIQTSLPLSINLFNVPHQIVRYLPQATSTTASKYSYVHHMTHLSRSPQALHTLSPSRHPNCYMIFSNLHHLSHPQVCQFISYKHNSLEPPSHLTSLQRNHRKT
jgi:hypothetical protein